MKTTETKIVEIEPADIQPLLDKALAAVGGKRIADIIVDRIADPNAGSLDGRRPTVGIGLTVMVTVETVVP